MLKTAPLASLALWLSLGLSPAHAQFGDFMKNFKGAVDGMAKLPAAPAPAPITSPATAPMAVPAPVAAAAPAPVPVPVAAAQPAPQAAAKKLDLEWPESEYAFACTSKGKTLSISNHFDSGDPYMLVAYGKRDAKTMQTSLDFRTTSKEPLLITEQTSQKKTITTVYFTVKGATYGISRCEGMFCNPEQTNTYWLSTFKGGKLASQEVCEEEPVIDMKMPVKTDKAGKMITQAKEFLQVRASRLDFDLQPN